MDKKALSIKIKGPKQWYDSPVYTARRQELCGYKGGAKDNKEKKNFRVDWGIFSNSNE